MTGVATAVVAGSVISSAVGASAARTALALSECSVCVSIPALDLVITRIGTFTGVTLYE